MSIKKKHKAKNSYINNGGEKSPNWKCKRLMYFTNTKRYKLKREVKDLF